MGGCSEGSWQARPWQAGLGLQFADSGKVSPVSRRPPKVEKSSTSCFLLHPSAPPFLSFARLWNSGDAGAPMVLESPFRTLMLLSWLPAPRQCPHGRRQVGRSRRKACFVGKGRRKSCPLFKKVSIRVCNVSSPVFSEPRLPSLNTPRTMRAEYLDTLPRAPFFSSSSENTVIWWRLFLPGLLVSLKGWS